MSMLAVSSLCPPVFVSVSRFILVQIPTPTCLRGKHERYFWRIRRQYWYKRSRLCRALRSHRIGGCDRSPRMRAHVLRWRGVSREISLWISNRIRSRALVGQIFYYRAWRRTYDSTYGAPTAVQSIGLRKISWGGNNVDSTTTLRERAATRKWTARSARNYSCKLGVCTRGKQARSRNFRNLMEIKLCFYIQSACKPYIRRPVSYYIAHDCFRGYHVRSLLTVPLFSGRGAESHFTALTIMLNDAASDWYIIAKSRES